MADANVIDSLTIVLGLDPRGLEKGRKEAAAEILKLRDQSKRAADETESRTSRTLVGLGKIRQEIVGLALAFAGARGVGDFVSSIISGDAATGRLARNLGVATESLSAWQYALRTVNGSAADANNSLSRMFGIIEEHKFQGVSSADPILTRLGLGQRDLSSPDSMLLALSENRTHDTRQERASLLGQLGLDENTVNVLLRGRRAVENLLQEGRRLGTTTDRDAAAAEHLQKRWAEFTTALNGQARPYIEAMVDTLLDLSKNTDAVSVAMPVLIGLVGAIGVAAAVANAPIVALAAVITGVALAVERLSTAEGRSRILRNITQDANFLKALWGAMHDPGGDPRGAWGRIGQVFSDAWNGGGAPAAGAAGGSGGATGEPAQTKAEQYLMSRGFTAAQARGVAAGIMAESRGNANADNPISHAYGLGQWLGPRKRALFAKYGPHPTARQQLEFLADEMLGDKQGGAHVRAAQDTDSALLAYVYDVMRPGKGAVGDIARGRAWMGGGGARLAVAPRATHSTSTNTNETHIGTITVHTRATDAKGIAADLPSAIRKRSLTGQANSGLSG
jgi:hypothetical protein